ncbi:coiled-coil domain-containing protein 150-like [Asterias amurensis]|uniref:coiled-coil domain-containing protein 150-like n=1 Tax=Asterias amurensis TaxID=7602 RepID=UPI003AB5F965
MAHKVIPPSRPQVPVGKSPTTQAFTLLQKKLNTAEAETVSLVRQLADLGFQTSNSSPESNSVQPVVPFLPATAEVDVLRKHYEALVARLCRTESQIQTLKLNLCALQAERDLSARERLVTQDGDQRLAELREAHEDELRRLNKELARTRKEWKDALEVRNEVEDEARRLSSALEAATNAKSELAMAYEELLSSKQKLNKRIMELREEITRETSLRSSLEDSHATLLERVQQMEGVVQSERQEVQILASDCSELRQEGARIQEEKIHHMTQQTQLSHTVKTLRAQLGAKEIELVDLLEENKVLLANLNGIQRENVAHQRLTEDTEKKRKLFDEERNNLYNALEQVKTANSSRVSFRQQLISQTETKSLVVMVTESLQLLGDERARLESELMEERDKRTCLDKLSSELQRNIQDVKEQLQLEKEQSLRQKKSLEDTVSQLRSELSSLHADKDTAIKVKQRLLEEVNLAVDGMSEERGKLHQELTQAKLEVTSLGQDKQYLEEENSRLMERVSAMEQQQDSQQKVQSTIAELLESKNRLAYDKGRLQNRVDQLQGEMASLAGAQADVHQLKKVNDIMQAKLSKTSGELSSARMDVQRLEGKLRQERDLSDRKEKDFTLAIQARDEAFNECQKVKGQIQVMEEREKQKAASFQRSLTDAKDDQTKIASTLEGVMVSHKQLQTAVENLQTELGRKDSELVTLRKERDSRQKSMATLQREVEKLQTNLVTMETQEGGQLDNVRSELSRVSSDKLKLSRTVDDLLQTNGQLQSTAERLQSQLEKRNHKYKLLQEARSREQSSLQEQLHSTEDRLHSLQQQLASKRDSSIKNATKELAHIQQTNTDLMTRVKELSRTNADILKKVASLEETCGKQRDRIHSLKSQLEGSHRLRKTNTEMTEKIKDINRQLSEMEAAKREYARKNNEQAKTISSFVNQVSELQADLLAISGVQESMSEASRKKDEQVEKERSRREEIQLKAKELQKKLIQLQEEKSQAEVKLLEASSESFQISANLHEAQSWFKTRYETLQKELVEARQRQSQLEKNNTEQQQKLLEERMKAAEQAQKARNMMRASRHALNQLSRQAESDAQKTKSQMTTMVQRLQAEKDHAAYTDGKLKKFMDASGQYIEELAFELDHYRSHGDTL